MACSSGPAHRYHYAHKWPKCEAVRQKHSSHRHVFAHHYLQGKAVLVGGSTGCWSVYAFSSNYGLCTWWRGPELLCWCCHLFAGGICLPFHRRQTTGSGLQAVHLPLWLPCGRSSCSPPASLQKELVELQCNDELKTKHCTVSSLSFFRDLVLPSNKFSKLHWACKHIVAMFGSTYCWEHLFSKIKYTKFHIHF